MFYTLSDLDLRDPSMWGVGHFAVITLLIMHDEFDLECLLQHCIVLNFFLNR